MLRKTVPAVVGWWVLLLSGSAGSATLLETSELLAETSEAAAQLSPAYEFTLTDASQYTVTLTDITRNFGTQTRLQSLQVLIARGLDVATTFQVEYPVRPDGTVAQATRTFTGTPGKYRVHVLGKIPADGAGGAFNIKIAPSAGGQPILDKEGLISANGGPAANQSVLQTQFTTPSAGTHELIVNDRAFPAALTRTQVVLLRSSGEMVVQADPPAPVTFQGTFDAAAGERFELIVIGTADAGQAGLYGVRVENPTNAVVYSSENVVGLLPAATTVVVPSAGTYALSLTDLQFPSALTSMSAAVIQNGSFIGRQSGAGTNDLPLAQGSALLYVFNSTATVGAMAVRLEQDSQLAYADVHLADASPDLATPSIYSFEPSAAVGSGNYTLTVEDFRFPSPLTSIETAVVQGTSSLVLPEGSRAHTVPLGAGPVRVLVAAVPSVVAGVPGVGMFGLTLATQPGNAVHFESTQGVGGLFNVRTVEIPAAARYDATLKDFEFPAQLRTSWLAITRGTMLAGQVVGSSTFRNLQLEAGTYVLNFLGQPATNEAYGAFGLKVEDSAPPPVVTLSASPTAVASGQATTLTWSATDATSCTASGGWSGSKGASGNQPINGLTANSTFEIECVGPGGRANASVSVTVTAPSADRGSGGGGGQVDLLLLISLATMWAWARMVREGRDPR